MTFSLCVGELTDLSCASAKSFARTGHDLYVYPREQADSASFEILRQAGVRICDACAFYSCPVRYEHPRWGGYAPFADVFRYTAMRRLGAPWVDLDGLLLDPGKLPLGPSDMHSPNSPSLFTFRAQFPSSCLSPCFCSKA